MTTLVLVFKKIEREDKTKYDITHSCFKWWLVRYLNPVDHHPAKITKPDKDRTKTLDFKDINFPVKIRDTHKIERKNLIDIRNVAYENKEKYRIYVSKKCCEEKHVCLL